jgi:hypothetical protein
VAEYVGAERYDQLERFEDHFMGEWDDAEAYAEHLLEEMEAYRYVEGAPEWLQPYLKVDVESYASDLEIEMYIVDTGDGRVWASTRTVRKPSLSNTLRLRRLDFRYQPDERLSPCQSLGYKHIEPRRAGC